MLEDDIRSMNVMYRESDSGSYDFTHKRWQEYFTASWIADQLVSGSMSMQDVRERFWMYQRDPATVNPPTRVDLIKWRRVILFVSHMLSDRQDIDLVHVLTDDYFMNYSRARWAAGLAYRCALEGIWVASYVIDLNLRLHPYIYDIPRFKKTLDIMSDDSVFNKEMW